MSRNALLVTELRQDKKTEQWLSTTEELVLGPIDLPCDDSRVIVEEVQVTGSWQQ